MASDRSIPPDLKARIDAVAAKTNLTPADILNDALENGHSLEWQERFLEKIEKGIAAADRGDFATLRSFGAFRTIIALPDARSVDCPGAA